MRLRARLLGLVATLALVGILLGLPAVLLAVGADALPDSIPSMGQLWAILTSPDDGTLALALITVVGWAAWIFLAGSILLEIASRLRGVQAPRLPGLSLPQTTARGLISTALLLFVAVPASAPPAQAWAIPTAPIVTSSSTAFTASTALRASVQASAGAPSPHLVDVPASAARDNAVPRAGIHAGQGGGKTVSTPGTVTHTVRAGESLWSIAEHHLGSGRRFPEIAALNTDVLGNKPSFLKAGTVLVLPTPSQAAPTNSTNTTNTTGGAGQETRPGPAVRERVVTVVTVVTGDTLSEIAQQELGEAGRYPEIFEASTGTRQPGGVRLTDPDRIYPGWKLTIPGAPARADQGPAVTAKHAAPAVKKPVPGLTHAPATPQRQEAIGPSPPSPAPPPPAQSGPSTSSVDRNVVIEGGPSTRTPDANPTGTGTPTVTEAEAREAGGEQSAESTAPWMLAGLVGGGGVLAGSMLLVLRRRQRAQFRSRRPGRTIATPVPVLAPVEKTVTVVGSATAPTVEYVDEAMRRLAAARAQAGQNMPQLLALELTASTVNLHLSDPTTLGEPWQGSDDLLRWSLPAGSSLDDVGPALPDQPAPYPMLTTIGVSETGDVWLLNCEDVHLSITGDLEFGRDLARYLAAEIACNPWSHGVLLDLHGVGHEVASMNPGRLRTHPAADPTADVLTDAINVVDRSAEVGHSVPTARAMQAGDEAWPGRMLMLDAGGEQPAALGQLLELLQAHAGRTGTSVVVCGERAQHGSSLGVELRVTASGRLVMPASGLDLIAVGLTSDEALGCAALLAQSDELDDVKIPASDDAPTGWRAWSNEAGALREEHTLPRNSDEAVVGEPVASVLELGDQEYVREGATTAEDLQALAPKVAAHVSEAVLDADPTLDEDLAAWWAQDCPLPRLSLLGPVSARTRGTPMTKRKHYFTEMLTYLAMRPHGATPSELADAFNITQAKARDYIRIVRDWLGDNPRTGDKHLPDARKAPAAVARGVGVYQVQDVLVDADLFRRLRVRGEARGPGGINDLRSALRLVQGRPFSSLRHDRWYWLYEGDRVDQHLLCAVVDVAHLVTTYSLRAGDLRQARLAAETAALAAPDEEIPRLDLAAVADAEGRGTEAERILYDEVLNRSDDQDAPPDLTERTQQIIAGKDWLDRTRHAS